MFQQNNPTAYTTISYHMSWPGSDPYYDYNSPDGNTRRNFYGLNWVPYMVIDGQNDEGNTAAWETHILNNAATTSPLEITIAGSFNYQTGNGGCMITLNPETGVSGNYTLHMVLVEDGLYWEPSYQNYDDHANVMRDMFPSSQGQQITLEAGVQSIIEVPYSIPADLEVANCRLTVFVQASDHTVLNAATVAVTEITPLNIPYLSVLSSSLGLINDDGDEKLSPGESANFAVTVENACDWLDAQGVTGYLSSSDPNITVTDSVGEYDLIVSCDNVNNIGDLFTFSVSADAPPIGDLEFQLRLTANQDTEVPYETTIPITLGMDMFQNNFPISVTQPLISGNAAADLDGDGNQEIIIGGSDSLVHVYTLDGSELSGFPYVLANKIVGAPAVADIDGDGELEIVVTSRDKHIHVIEADGSGTTIAEAGGYLIGTPALADLDNDGELEIVAGGFAHDILVVNPDGSALPSYPVSLGNERMSSGVALGDLDGDGAQDIVVGTWGNNVHALDLSGNELPGFPVDVGDHVAAAPVLADLDGDGNLEILVGQDDGLFYALSNTGATLWTQQLSTSGIRTAAAVADFDNDGNLETVFTTLDGFITVIDHLGNELAGWPQSLIGACYSSPVIADLDGDDIPEIIVGSNTAALFAFHIDGTTVQNFPIPLSSPARGTPTVADLDGDGTLELIVGTDYDLSVINLKINSQVGTQWATARGSNLRDGLYLYTYVGVEDEVSLPKTLVLRQNYPNPFNPSTTLSFGVPQTGPVTLAIYDVQGRLVNQLTQGDLSAGYYNLEWNGQNSQGSLVATGIYFARIKAGSTDQVVKMLLVK